MNRARTALQELYHMSLHDLANLTDAELRRFEALCDNWYKLAERERNRRAIAKAEGGTDGEAGS